MLPLSAIMIRAGLVEPQATARSPKSLILFLGGRVRPPFELRAARGKGVEAFEFGRWLFANFDTVRPELA